MLDFKTMLLPKGLKTYFKNESPRENELYFLFTGKLNNANLHNAAFEENYSYF